MRGGHTCFLNLTFNLGRRPTDTLALHDLCPGFLGGLPGRNQVIIMSFWSEDRISFQSEPKEQI